METEQKKTGLFAYEYYGSVSERHPMVHMVTSDPQWDSVVAAIQSSLANGIVRALAVDPKPFELPAQYFVEDLPIIRPEKGGEDISVLAFSVITYRSWIYCKIGDYVAIGNILEAKETDQKVLLKKPRFVTVTDEYPPRIPFEVYKFAKRTHTTPGTEQAFTVWELMEIKPIS